MRQFHNWRTQRHSTRISLAPFQISQMGEHQRTYFGQCFCWFVQRIDRYDWNPWELAGCEIRHGIIGRRTDRCRSDGQTRRKADMPDICFISTRVEDQHIPGLTFFSLHNDLDTMSSLYLPRDSTNLFMLAWNQRCSPSGLCIDALKSAKYVYWSTCGSKMLVFVIAGYFYLLIRSLLHAMIQNIIFRQMCYTVNHQS